MLNLGGEQERSQSSGAAPVVPLGSTEAFGEQFGVISLCAVFQVSSSHAAADPCALVRGGRD